MRRKKILLVSEAHYLNTGYSIISNEVLKALYSVPEFEVAEFANYGLLNNPAAQKCPWKFYANSVDQNDPRIKDYNEHEYNKFGQWRIDKVLLDFRPDILICLRDAYMDGCIVESPLSKYCHTIMHVPVDSSPQRPEWLEMYSKAEGVFTYTKFGLDVLKKECPKANLIGTLGAGVDFDIFRPLDKLNNRKKHGVAEDITIFGTVNRNQVRKHFSTLIAAFARFRERLTPEERNTVYLYLHTAVPDVEGWNITSMLHEYGVASNTLATYICKFCRHIFPLIWQDALGLCPNCGNVAATHPTVQTGLTREQLNEIYNLFDLYVHVANCEGQGFGPMEAAATGCAIACTDFSGLRDYISNLKAYPLQVADIMRDLRNDSYRCTTSEEAIAGAMNQFMNFSGPQSTPIELVRKHYSWPDKNRTLISYIHSLPIEDRWSTISYKEKSYPEKPPEGLSNSKFIDFIFTHILSEDRYSYYAKSMEYSLSIGVKIGDKKPKPLDQKLVYEYAKSIAAREKAVEQIRLGVKQLPQEDWLQFANRTR